MKRMFLGLTVTAATLLTSCDSQSEFQATDQACGDMAEVSGIDLDFSMDVGVVCHQAEWICHNPESKLHNQVCSEKCLVPGDNSKFCWYREGYCEEN